LEKNPNTEEEILLKRIEQSDLEKGINPKIILLRQKLAQKAKRQPKFRFYSLYSLICRKDVLNVAWGRVYANGGSHGVDNVTFKDIIKANGATKLIEEIHEGLINKTYKPRAVRRVYIPKADGSERPLGIPTIKDRIVQMAALLILEPIFEADFMECSYGCRPGIQAHKAVKEIESSVKQGYVYVYDADMKGYFDSIPHDKLMACVRMRVTDKSVLNLIRMWLKAPIAETSKDKGKPPTISKPTQGTPQGGVISPLLANLYLHWFDKVFHGKENPVEANRARLIRYVDDFVVLTRYKSIQLEEFIGTKLEDWMGLIINREKTKVVKITEEKTSIEFLGFNMKFAPSKYRKGDKYFRITPKKKVMERARKRIRELTDRRLNCLTIKQVVKQINEYLLGWKGYFSIGHPYEAYTDIDYFVGERLIRHLKRRSQRGYKLGENETWYQHFRKIGVVRLADKKCEAFKKAVCRKSARTV
jgi:RNA-directed DNA polymerase